MSRIVINGNLLAAKIAEQIKRSILAEQEQLSKWTHLYTQIRSISPEDTLTQDEIPSQPLVYIKPRLDIINVGLFAPSLSYIQKKIQLAGLTGLNYHLHQFMMDPKTDPLSYRKMETIFTQMNSEATTVYSIEDLPLKNKIEELRLLIRKLNNQPETSGILLQLPLPEGMRDQSINLIEEITPEKDVDCLTLYNQSALIEQQSKPELLPCTPSAVLRILDQFSIDVQGMNTVMIGRSNLVGMPLAHLLLNRNATVTICHHLSTNVAELAQKADLVLSATGVPRLIKELKPNGISIDIGISRGPDGKLTGDICEKAKKESLLSTPVPGGVGPLTVTMLIENTFKLWRLQNRMRQGN